MKTTDSNPFYELFFTDGASPSDFTRYFSPFLVRYLRELFQPGHIILKGTQGSGKSMLLRLFEPEIRIAYADQREELKAEHGREVSFPVLAKDRNFIGAGANLSKSGLMDLVQRLPGNPSEEDFQHITDLFCDFFNYWQLRNLLNSIKLISERKDVFGILVKPECLDNFVRLLKHQDCWFGYLDTCDTFQDLQNRVKERVLEYRKWNARNIPRLGEEILTSKTAIGEPLSRVAECLKASGAIADETPIFLRIDQMEELWHRQGNTALLVERFRKVINRVIANRDSRVSYRIGTRRYAWSGNLEMPGGRKLEEGRDYLITDIDAILRRDESNRGLFPGFAADVFWHRVIKSIDNPTNLGPDRCLRAFLGASPTPHQLVERLIVTPPDSPQKLLKLDSGWSKSWCKYIQAVYDKKIERKRPKVSAGYRKNPMDALLVVAWGLQTGGKKGGDPRRLASVPESFPPWTGWWEKERLMMAAMQLIARHQQIQVWWGTESVINLSASNITIFLSLCRECWNQWRRHELAATDERGEKASGSEPHISWKRQAVAIDNVSKGWHRKFSNQPGRPAGDVRMRFVDELGNWFREGMLADSAMSYPGGNGLSLKRDDLDLHPKLKALIEEAVGWGDLYEVDHTPKNSKTKYRNPSRKYYLNQILSPHFQISESHTKEPLYERIEVIVSHAQKAGAIEKDESVRRPTPKEANTGGDLTDLPLFGGNANG